MRILFLLVLIFSMHSNASSTELVLIAKTDVPLKRVTDWGNSVDVDNYKVRIFKMQSESGFGIAYIGGCTNFSGNVFPLSTDDHLNLFIDPVSFSYPLRDESKMLYRKKFSSPKMCEETRRKLILSELSVEEPLRIDLTGFKLVTDTE
jgi:hypothetical protein